MYKKEAFRHLDKKYNSHLYSGMLGILMSYCHRKLEVFKKETKILIKFWKLELEVLHILNTLMILIMNITL